MSVSKRFLKHPTTQRLLSAVLACCIRLIFLANRKIYHIDPAALPYMRGEKNAIFAFWHGRMMLLPAVNPPRTMHVLISHHRDGLLISQVIERFGQKTIAGSSSRGGAEAVRAVVRALKLGDNVGITPDGPRGPNQLAEMGVAMVAKLSGRPVLPVAFFASRHRRLRSWDRFMIAKPFGRIVFCIGAPIMVEQADEPSRLAIERAMNMLMEKADAL